MHQATTYMKLSTTERKALSGLCRRKWISFGKRLLITFSLPFACLLALGIFLNAPILYGNLYLGRNDRYIIPASIDELKMMTMGFFFLWSLIFFFIVIVNIILFLKEIPPVYYDMLRNVKKRITFRPRPYTIGNHYYLQTDIPGFTFLEVSYEDYYNAGTGIYCLYLLPGTKQVLAVTKEDGTIVETGG